MINFFRKIRYNLMEQNKTGKYLKYAIGEIVLVMVGILLALQVNNWNENRRMNQKVVEILKEIQLDLKKDITKADDVINYYNRKKEGIKKLLNNQLTFDDFKNNPLSSKFIILTAEHIKLHDNGYRNLMINSNIIPDKFKKLLKPLNEIYVYDKYEIDKFDDKLNDITNDYEQYLIENHHWYNANVISLTISDEMINYLKDSKIYKNYAIRYSFASWSNLSSELAKYRYDAISVYNEINRLIGKEVESVEQLNYNYINTDTLSLEALTGRFELINQRGLNYGIEKTFKISLDENQLYYEPVGDGSEHFREPLYFRTLSELYDKNGMEYKLLTNAKGVLTGCRITYYFTMFNNNYNDYKKKI